ncbi:site-specific DNA-methyltransferase [Ekhidna sp.]|uniref:site-specific DNA-methyltransferase n=1 Tax=Ekhidna sp. TaxID=2608089 RepID=UPI003B5A72B2
MTDEQKITNNIKVPNQNMEVLKKHFGHCFDKNGAFDLEKFKQELSESEMNFSKESYGLDWLGKSYARLLASDEAKTLLKEDEAFNQKPENKDSQNLLIKGDNLEVLKHLSNAYYESVKMIYIDPPYNTGSDGFVYNDDRKFTVKELQQLAGVDEEKAKRILDFTQSNSNSHSAWLTFMYPRLYIARQLLKEEGVIFISIDENEHSQLRLLCDEVFGEENFVGDIVWKNKYNSGASTTGISNIHEYLLCYSKAGSVNIETELDEDSIKKYNKKDDKFSVRGGYVTQPLATGSKDDRPNLVYPIIYDGKEIWPEKQWIWSRDRVEEAIKNDEVVFNPAGDSYNPRVKQYLKDEHGKIRKGKPISILIGPYNQEGSKEIKELFGKNVFGFPKPTNLIKYFISFTLNESEDKDGIYLDFFAGSGSTGEAVMRLNAEDGGTRRYILTQLPEVLNKKKDKAAYDFVKEELKIDKPTIFEITKERLIRAAKKVKNEAITEKVTEKETKIKELEGELDLEDKAAKIEQLKQDIEGLKNQDLGFRIFETMPIWEDYGLEADEQDKQTKLFDESKLTEEDLKSLLVTWKTNDGIALTEDLEATDLAEYKGYYCKGNLYLMHKGFDTDHLKALLEKIDSDKTFNPTSVIAFGYQFESKSLREIAENIKSYANKKNIDIDFIIRY